MANPHDSVLNQKQLDTLIRLEALPRDRLMTLAQSFANYAQPGEDFVAFLQRGSLITETTVEEVRRQTQDILRTQQTEQPIAASTNSTPEPVARSTARQKKMLGHYEIIRELGRGGMGIVYQAKDTKLDRMVALKTILPQLSSDIELMTRFEKEAKSVAQLNHPNIIQIYGIEEIDNKHAIVMPFFEHGSLEEKIRLGGRLEEDEARSIYNKITAALNYMHSKGIVHRDLKPQNILFDHNKEPILTDFGLAKAANLDYSLSVTGQFVGTVAYAAPEQIQNAKGIDGQADFWALGVTLFEMLTGQRPFTGESQMVLAKAIVSGKPKDIKDLRPDLSEDLAQEVAKCLRIELAAKERVQAPDEVVRTARPIWFYCSLLLLLVSLASISVNVVHYAWAGVRQNIELEIKPNGEAFVRQLVLHDTEISIKAREFSALAVMISNSRWFVSSGERVHVANGEIWLSKIIVGSEQAIDFQNVKLKDSVIEISGKGSLSLRNCSFLDVSVIHSKEAVIQETNCSGVLLRSRKSKSK